MLFQKLEFASLNATLEPLFGGIGQDRQRVEESNTEFGESMGIFWERMKKPSDNTVEGESQGQVDS